MQQPMRGIHILHGVEDVKGRGPEFVFGAVVVDGDADVVFLHEFFDERKGLRRGIAGDNDRDAGALAVFELAADVGIVGLCEINRLLAACSLMPAAA